MKRTSAVCTQGGKPDLLALVDAAYRLDLSEAECLRELSRAGDVLDGRRPQATFTVPWRGPSGPPIDAFEITRGGEEHEAAARAINNAIPLVFQREMQIQPPGFAAIAELPAFEQALQVPEARGIADVKCLLCPTGTGEMLVLATIHDRPAERRASPADLQNWRAVAAHLASAWRLRKRLLGDVPLETRVEGVFEKDGRCVFARGAARGRAAQAVLREAIAKQESALLGKGARHEARSTFWSDLIAGRWTLLRHLHGDERYTWAVRNDAVAAPLRALSDSERNILRLVRSGASNKQIAADLAISEPAVSRLLHSAVRKLGLPGAVELAHFPWDRPDMSFTPYQLGPDELLRIDMPLSKVDTLAGLTKSERDVLADLLRGYSNRVISVRRDRSPKTVANQVASVFSKLRVHSRREVALAMSSGEVRHP